MKKEDVGSTMERCTAEYGGKELIGGGVLVSEDPFVLNLKSASEQ